MPKKLNNIQALRGIAVLLVVIYHTMPILLKYNLNFGAIPNSFSFGYVGVDIFFVISGFIMVMISKDSFGNRNVWRIHQFYKFIYFRFTRIYPLYWLYSILLLPIFFIKPEWVNSSQDHVDLISSFLLFPSDVLPLLLVGWTLNHEIYFYIIFGLFILFINKNDLFKYSLIWFCFVLFTNIIYKENSPLIKLIINPLTIEFIFGILIGIYFIKYNHRLAFAKTFLFLSFFSLFILAYYHNILPALGGNWHRVVVGGIPASLIVFFSIEVEKQGLILNQLLIKIGDASYSIYLSHILVLNTVAKISSLFLIKNYIFELAMATGMLIITVLYGLISYKYIEIPIINYTRFIYNERKSKSQFSKSKDSYSVAPKTLTEQ